MSHVKYCPNCGNIIEKDDVTGYLTCTECNAIVHDEWQRPEDVRGRAKDIMGIAHYIKGEMECTYPEANNAARWISAYILGYTIRGMNDAPDMVLPWPAAKREERG